MNKFLILAIVISIQGSLFGQFVYEIDSKPDNAVVTINGDSIGVTPLNYEFYWNKYKKFGGLNVVVYKEGYETWSELLDKKPLKFKHQQNIVLKRKLAKFGFDSTSVLIAFDRLVANFREDKVVGKYVTSEGAEEIIYWEGSIKIGDESFEKSFNDMAINIGYKTPISENAKLFSNQSRSTNQLPRYMIGAKLIDCNYDLVAKSRSLYGVLNIEGVTTFDIQWQILDKSTGEVVSTFNNTGSTKFSANDKEILENDNLIAFEDALIDFLENSELEHLVRNSDSNDIKENNLEKEELKVYEIVDPDIPEFNNLSEMIAHTQSSCVTIITDGGHGSGVVLNQEGLVLSAFHVVEGVNRIEVNFSNGIKLEASIVSFDRLHDVVLLDVLGSGFKSIPIGSSASMTLGNEVVTIGTPADLALGQSVSKGIISGKRKFENNVYIQTDVAVSPGNSGGPLLNLKGEIVGVIQRKIIGDGVEGIGFALPIETAIDILGIKVSK